MRSHNRGLQLISLLDLRHKTYFQLVRGRVLELRLQLFLYSKDLCLGDLKQYILIGDLFH